MTLTPSALHQLNNALRDIERHIRQADSFSIGVTSVDRRLGAYQDELSQLAEKARKGELSQAEFENQAEELVTAALLALFNLGRQSDELDYEATAAYEQEKVFALLAVRNLSRDIYGGRYSEQTDNEDNVTLSDEDGQAHLESRIVLWAATAAGLYALGQLHREATIKYTWRLGATSRHCVDCLRLDGQIHTALEWRLSGYRPQGSALACGGWKCDCRYEETDKKGGGIFRDETFNQG